MKDSSDYTKFKSFQEKLNKIYLCKSGGTMTGTINMSCNDILKVQNLTFCEEGTLTIPGSIDADNITVNNNLIFNFNNTNYVMTFSDFSSNTQMVALPSINNQPISLMRTSILYNPNFLQTLPGGSGNVLILDLSNSIVENQLNLGISGNIISPSLDISGQYVELYANIEITPSVNNTEISFDISGVDCNFLEIIDTRYTSRINNYYLTYGPHMFIPSQWANCGQFVFKLTNHLNGSVTIRALKIVFKSYYI
jgi:hypothetical protein